MNREYDPRDDEPETDEALAREDRQHRIRWAAKDAEDDMIRPTFRDVRDHYACENCDGKGVFRTTEMMSGQDRETGTPFYIAHEDPCPACNGTGITPEGDRNV